MNPGESDRELHAAFQASRAAERSGAPPFSQVLLGRGSPAGWLAGTRPKLRWVLATGAAVLLLVFLLHRVVSAPRPSPAGDLAAAQRIMAWRSPTEALFPIRLELLRSTPRFGSAVSASPLRALDPGGPLGPPLLTRSHRL